MGTYIESLRTWLLECGYTPGSIKHVLTLAGQLRRWMEGSDVKFSQLDSVAVESFLDALRARGVRRVPGPRGLRPVLDYLDSEGALAFKPVPDSPIERLVVEYRTWLVVDRGLAAPTVLRYENLAPVPRPAAGRRRQHARREPHCGGRGRVPVAGKPAG
jgi:hypothetical protein